MVGLWLKREGMLPFGGASQRSAALRVSEPTDTWMGVYAPGGTRIGFVNTTANPDLRDARPGVAYMMTAKLRLTLLSTPTELLVSGSAWIPQSEGTAEFDFKIKSGEHDMRVTATVADGQLNGTIRTAGESIPLKLPVSKDLLLAGGMGTMALNVPLMEVGGETVIDAFDPMTLSMGKAHVKCVGEETVMVGGQQIPTKVIETTINGMTTKAWGAGNGEIVRAETPFGFSLRKVTVQEALSPLEGGESNLIEMVAIRPTGKKPFRGAKRMIIRLAGVNADTMPPTDEMQTAVGDVYTIMTSEAPNQSTATAEPGVNDDDLNSDTFVQSDSAKIRETASDIVGAETDPWKKAMLVYAWVFENIEKTPVLSVPSALEVLETREGDCNEHTVLYTALARAVGVPTRIAIGVVWSGELDGFFYHAWPEVYVGKWIAMEPTLGQPIADATHIKLVNGNIEKWPRLIPYIGQLQVDVMSVE